MFITRDQQVGLAFVAYLVVPLVILLLVWFWGGLRRLFGRKKNDGSGDGEA